MYNCKRLWKVWGHTQDRRVLRQGLTQSWFWSFHWILLTRTSASPLFRCSNLPGTDVTVPGSAYVPRPWLSFVLASRWRQSLCQMHNGWHINRSAQEQCEVELPAAQSFNLWRGRMRRRSANPPSAPSAISHKSLIKIYATPGWGRTGAKEETDGPWESDVRGETWERGGRREREVPGGGWLLSCFISNSGQAQFILHHPFIILVPFLLSPSTPRLPSMIYTHV